MAYMTKTIQDVETAQGANGQDLELMGRDKVTGELVPVEKITSRTVSSAPRVIRVKRKSLAAPEEQHEQQGGEQEGKKDEDELEGVVVDDELNADLGFAPEQQGAAIVPAQQEEVAEQRKWLYMATLKELELQLVAEQDAYDAAWEQDEKEKGELMENLLDQDERQMDQTKYYADEMLKSIQKKLESAQKQALRAAADREAGLELLNRERARKMTRPLTELETGTTYHFIYSSSKRGREGMRRRSTLTDRRVENGTVYYDAVDEGGAPKTYRPERMSDVYRVEE